MSYSCKIFRSFVILINLYWCIISLLTCYNNTYNMQIHKDLYWQIFLWYKNIKVWAPCWSRGSDASHERNVPGTFVACHSSSLSSRFLSSLYCQLSSKCIKCPQNPSKNLSVLPLLAKSAHKRSTMSYNPWHKSIRMNISNLLRSQSPFYCT